MKVRAAAGARRPSVRARIGAALETLSERDRLVLVLRLVEGLSVLETAGALRMKTHEVENRMTSALRAMSDEFADRSAKRRVA